MRSHLSLLSLLILSACASPRATAPAPTGATPAPAAATNAPSSPTLARAKLEQVLQLARDHSFDRAEVAVTALLGSENFVSLAAAERHQTLSLGAMLALQAHDPKRAQALATRACEMHEAQSFDWLLRVEAGIAAADAQDTVLAARVVAERWPQHLPRSVHGLESAPEAVRYQVLTGLFNFSMPHEPAGASAWWRDLALLQLERGERAAAVSTAARVANAYIVVSIEADRRFDPVRRELSTRLDVGKIAQRAVDAAATRAQNNPDKLQPLNELAGLLGESLQVPQVLQVTDTAIEQVSKWGEVAYSDYDPEYSQLLDERAQALAASGRWDAAVIQLQAASLLTENGAGNVSQLIDLAALFNGLGRAPEARTTLRKLNPDNASAVGVMRYQKENLRAALALGDAREADLALRFLEAHREEALDAYQEALLLADRQEAGAKLLIQRLGRAHARSAALLAVQEYSAGSLTPVQAANLRRWQELLARADVKEAVNRVGRVGQYPLAAGHYY